MFSFASQFIIIMAWLHRLNYSRQQYLFDAMQGIYFLKSYSLLQ